MSATLHVLVIDDEPIVGKRLLPALEKIGCSVEFYTDPHEALRRFDQKPADIVVADIRMEGMDGIQILEHVMRKSMRTKVIMITGYATLEVAREAQAKGAFDFIAKPFKPADLRQIISKAAQALESSGARSAIGS
jgi:DNA-binding NtrC family response regulator